MLGAPEHFPFYFALFEDIFDLFDDEIDKVMPLVQFLVNVFDEKLVRFGFEVFETQIFQLALDLGDTQPARERGVNVQRFLRHFDLALLGQEVERTHIVQTVCQLDDDDADVLGHGDEDLAEIFRFLFLAGLEHDLVQLGDAADQFEHFLAEFGADVVLRGGRVLDDVVQKGGGDGGAVQTQFDEDLRDRAGVDKIRLPRSALLAAVRLFRVVIGADEHFAVGTRVVVINHLQDNIHCVSFNAHTAR